MPSEKRILITTHGPRATELSHKLAARGFEPVLFPCIEISTGESAAIDSAIGLISQFHWLIFDSPHSVEAFWARLATLGLDERIFREQRFGVLGKATARALTKHGPLAEFVAEPEASVEATQKMGAVRGQWVLILQSAEWEMELGKMLATHGAVVRAVNAYTTQPPASAASGWANVQPPVQAITFCEPAAVKNFVALVGREAAQKAITTCLDATTAAEVNALGLTAQVVVAGTPTIDGLIEALARHFSHL